MHKRNEKEERVKRVYGRKEEREKRRGEKRRERKA